jgi:hypothetical protein
MAAMPVHMLQLNSFHHLSALLCLVKEDKHSSNRRMVSSGMLRRVALVRTDVSEEFRASFIRVIRIGELRTMLAASIVSYS